MWSVIISSSEYCISWGFSIRRGFHNVLLFSSAWRAGHAACNNLVSEQDNISLCLSYSNNTMVWDLSGELPAVHASIRARVPQPLPGLYPSRFFANNSTSFLFMLVFFLFLYHEGRFEIWTIYNVQLRLLWNVMKYSL